MYKAQTHEISPSRGLRSGAESGRRPRPSAARQRPIVTDQSPAVALCPHCGHPDRQHTGPGKDGRGADVAPVSDYECGRCTQTTSNDDGSSSPCACPGWYPGLTDMQMTAATIRVRAACNRLADPPPFAPTAQVRKCCSPVQLELFGTAPERLRSVRQRAHGVAMKGRRRELEASGQSLSARPAPPESTERVPQPELEEEHRHCDVGVVERIGHSALPSDVALPADVERDLARILARALVQQFLADQALLLEVSPCPDAGPVQVNDKEDQKADR